MDNLQWAFEPEKIQRTPYKGEIGDIERQLDELIGFTPSETNTLKGIKRDYAERMGLIEQAKTQAPPEVVGQIEKLQEQLERLRHAKEVQHNLDKELNDLENGQSNNKNIHKVVEIIKVSGTKLQQKYKAEFVERMKEKTVVVNGDGWSIPLDEYIEQERYRRPEAVTPCELTKAEYKPDSGESGILSKESIFETNLWYLRNHQGFDLSVRNGRRVRR